MTRDQKARFLTPWYIVIVCGLVDIANGLARVLSLGQYQPGWGVQFTGWRIRRYLKQQGAK